MKWLPAIFVVPLFVLFGVLASNAAPVPTLRTIPVIVLDGDRSGFTWVYTVDSRNIRICVTHMPIPASIPCYIATGNTYVGGIDETVVGEVVLVPPPVLM